MTESDAMRKLAEKWLNGTISVEEKIVFETWYNRQLPGSMEWSGAGSEDELKERIRASIFSRLDDETEIGHRTPVVAMQNGKRGWKRFIAVAASIILLSGIFSYWFFFSHNIPGSLTAEKLVADTLTGIAAPSAVNATLTLSDGSVISLDGHANGAIAHQGNMQVMKLSDGQIAYTGSGRSSALVYNTLRVPRGSKVVSLTLSDGSRVWLNSESSLRYPVAFGNDERRVMISGEAYFEVAPLTLKGKQRRMPFIVKIIPPGTGDNLPPGEGSEIEVLGTHFNVNAYKGNTDTKITLLEGSVKVSAQAMTELLRPGHQARIHSDGAITIHNNVDMEGVMAWKNGFFKFNDEDLQTIMAEIQRWYNVEIVYEGRLRPLNFGGIISRKENVSAVLELIQLTGVVRFSMEPSATGGAGRIIVKM